MANYTLHSTNRFQDTSIPFPMATTSSPVRSQNLLRKGNSRPTPGPDGWEKWFLRHITDDSLSIILRLLNFIISNSHFPSCTKHTNISTIHKRGPNTLLTNYRGIACSNLILNLPFAWLNTHLSPYVTQQNIVPQTQVAAQPGTQPRDLLSFISQVETWAARQNLPLYILQRDQKKGFDMLEPQGFYDAITAYGLPQSIIDLDRSSQANVPYRIKTAYGFTDTFSVDGVTKQGGSLSPLKCVLTTSLCNHWLSDLHSSSTGTLQISSINHIHQTPHTPHDNLTLQPSMVEAALRSQDLLHHKTRYPFLQIPTGCPFFRSIQPDS